MKLPNRRGILVFYSDLGNLLKSISTICHSNSKMTQNNALTAIPA
jgi:hypothetical protein